MDEGCRLRGITGVILAGGENRRFPEVKALIKIDGQTIIERHLSILRTLFDDVVISTNTPELFFRFGAPMIGDVLPSLGPISGIHAALCHTSADAVFVVASDMPFIHRDAISRICKMYCERADNPSVTAVVPSLEGEPQPLFGVYRRTLKEAMARAVAERKTTMKRFLGEVKATIISEPCVATGEPKDRVFVNINTLEDYRSIFRVQYQP